MNSKAKGGKFEREICKKLSLWVSEGKREDLFWRSAMSGGRATVGHRKGKDLRHQAGDICAVHPEGHKLTDVFYIECKHYRDLELGRLVRGEGKLFSFWKTTIKEANKYERQPLLIVKENNTPVLLLSNILHPALGGLLSEMAVRGESKVFRFGVYKFDAVVGGDVNFGNR